MSKSFLVTNDFYDAVTGDLIKAGSTFEADAEREEALRLAGVISKTAKEPDAGKDEKPEWPKHVGGGTFELSNGEKIKGKEEAAAAQAELDAAVEPNADNSK